MTINLLLSAYAAPALPSRSRAQIPDALAEITTKPQIRSQTQPRHRVSQAKQTVPGTRRGAGGTGRSCMCCRKGLRSLPQLYLSKNGHRPHQSDTILFTTSEAT